MAGSRVFLAEVKPVTLLKVKRKPLGKEEDLLHAKHFKQAPTAKTTNNSHGSTNHPQAKR
jgi:hypothetical protein